MERVTDTIICTWSFELSEGGLCMTTGDIHEHFTKILPINPVTNDTTTAKAEQDSIQMIKLEQLKKILFVSQDRQESEQLYNYLVKDEKTWMVNEKCCVKFNYCYTIKDTHHNHLKDKNHEGKLLNVPPFPKLFLVSPPQSPVPEFDYSQVEESPNKNPHPHILIPDMSLDDQKEDAEEHARDMDNDIKNNNKIIVGYENCDTELLTVSAPQPFKIFLTRQLEKYQDGSLQTLKQSSENSDIANELHRLNNHSFPTSSENSGIQKTAIPPRSIFEDDEDLLDDDLEE